MNRENFNLIVLNIGLAKHHADWNYKKIRSPFARIYYVTKGAAYILLENSSYALKPNYLYLIPPFTIHTDECFGEFELYYLHFFETEISPIRLFERYSFPFESLASELDLILIKRLISIHPQRELKKYDPKSYDNTSTFLNNIADSAKAPAADSLETQGIIQQLLSRFMNRANAKIATSDERILKSIEYIHNHIDQDINIKELASMACLSDDHFIRMFKKEIKQTPLAYINQKKIEKAQFLLIFTSQSIKSIAFHLSFGNISYFNRLFKRQTGYTPLSYRSSVL
jgi:AraC-like DNA-binding protein